MVAEEAPDAIDMFWGNVHKSPSQKRALEAVGGLIRAGITIFFVVPVAYLNQYFGPEIMEVRPIFSFFITIILTALPRLSFLARS